MGKAGCQKLPAEHRQCWSGEREAEELTSTVGQGVRLINDHDLGSGKQITTMLPLERKVRTQQMMIHDQQLRLGCGLSSPHNWAFRELGAGLTEAILSGRCHQWPDR